MARFKEILAGLLCVSLFRKGPLCCSCSCFNDVESDQAERLRAQTAKDEALKARLELKKARLETKAQSKSERRSLKMSKGRKSIYNPQGYEMKQRSGGRKTKKNPRILMGGEIQNNLNNNPDEGNVHSFVDQNQNGIGNGNGNGVGIGNGNGNQLGNQENDAGIPTSTTSPVVEQIHTRRPKAKKERIERKNTRLREREERRDRLKNSKEERKMARKERKERSRSATSV